MRAGPGQGPGPRKRGPYPAPGPWAPGPRSGPGPRAPSEGLGPRPKPRARTLSGPGARAPEPGLGLRAKAPGPKAPRSRPGPGPLALCPLSGPGPRASGPGPRALGPAPSPSNCVAKFMWGAARPLEFSRGVANSPATGRGPRHIIHGLRLPAPGSRPRPPAAGPGPGRQALGPGPWCQPIANLLPERPLQAPRSMSFSGGSQPLMTPARGPRTVRASLVQASRGKLWGAISGVYVI